ncbi:MAG TPA: NlpC/P60 family protein, partial [Caulobacteraceae bacterium]|nr:NlpC/P60 family protein [Caulobacteraceae bacterium]
MSERGDASRSILARPDLAAASLEGIVAAERFEPTRPMRVAAAVAPLWAAPDPASERLDELIHGEVFEALESAGGFVWGQAARDGYVGFVPAAALAPAGDPPTHRVAAIRTYAFAEPRVRSAASGPFSLNALVAVAAEAGAFSRSADGAWFWTAHLAPIGRFERDPAAVAERFLGAPYLRGGRTSVGLDGPGLIQQAIYACGRALPREADLQLMEGREIPPAEAARGDLVGWRGHIGLLLDAARLIHASSHHMAVVIEPLDDAIARLEAAGRGPTV